MPSIDLSAGPIAYEEQGEGPTVVLLHGLLMDHTVWDTTLPHLPDGFRYLRPVLPLGGHRTAMRPDADLSLTGLVRLVAELLDRLDLDDVTLVHSDWGGALFLTALGLDQRVARQVVLPCEAFDNFPPGLPGRVAVLALRLPSGAALAPRQLRVGRLRRMPFLFGQMAARPIPDALMRGWTEGLINDAGVRRDLKRYGLSRFDPTELIPMTEAVQNFAGDVLVLWSPDNKVMPPEHGRRLAGLFPRGRLVEVPGARVLSMLDEPARVGAEIGAFLVGTSAAARSDSDGVSGLG